jgi:hypothetical protein
MKRVTGAALLSGLVASPLGVALAMLAVALNQLGGWPMTAGGARGRDSGGGEASSRHPMLAGIPPLG